MGLSANQNAPFIGLATALAIIALLGLVARMISKHMRKQSLLVDDYLLIASFVLYLAETVILCWGAVNAGIGHHVAALSPEAIVMFSKIFLICSCLQPTLLALAKVSILILYRTIFVTRRFRILVNVLVAVVVGWWISILLANLFICWPLQTRWDPTVPAHCGNEAALGIFAPVPWILTDLVILISPLPMIRKLKLPTRQKVALALLFLIGGLSCVASIVRFQYVFYQYDDTPWSTVPLIEWNLVEASITILVVSLIAAKQAVLKLVPERVVDITRSFIYRSYIYFSKGTAKQKQANSSNGKGQFKTSEKLTYHVSHERLPDIFPGSQNRVKSEIPDVEQHQNFTVVIPQRTVQANNKTEMV